MRTLVLAGVVLLGSTGAAAQTPASVDTSKIGPQAGTTLPDFEGIDQFGKRHTLASIYGPKGAMVVFFRSADW